MHRIPATIRRALAILLAFAAVVAVVIATSPNLLAATADCDKEREMRRVDKNLPRGGAYVPQSRGTLALAPPSPPHRVLRPHRPPRPVRLRPLPPRSSLPVSHAGGIDRRRAARRPRRDRLLLAGAALHR